MIKKITIVVLLMLSISCNTKNESTSNNMKDGVFDSRGIEVYEIKLNSFQIDQVGKKRYIVLEENQRFIIKNKIDKFSVNGPNAIMPEGWFHAKWVKSDTIVIRKYLIDNFDQTIINPDGFEVNQKQKNIKVNVDLSGKLFYNEKEVTTNFIISKIEILSKKVKPSLISIYLSNAPYDNERIKNEVYGNIDKIKKYCERKKIHFQED